MKRALGWLLVVIDWPFCRFDMCLFVRFPRLGGFFWTLWAAPEEDNRE